MKKDIKIWEAALQALQALGGSGSLGEIFSEILSQNLYDFGTGSPVDAPHVLDTELRRKCSNSNRTDKSGEMLFEFNEGVYRILKKGDKAMNEKKASGNKRIHRARDKEGIITALMSEQVGVFKEIWRLLLFAAQIGIQEHRRESLLSVDSGKGIDQTTFGNSPSWPGLCYLIALVEEDNSEILSGTADAEDLRLAIFQEYANGGLSTLREHFGDKVIDLDGVVSFISNRSQKVNQDPDLDLAI